MAPVPARERASATPATPASPRARLAGCADISRPAAGKPCDKCRTGYYGNAGSCQRCAAECSGGCTGAGAETCAECAAGYARSEVGAPCGDVDECAAGTGTCEKFEFCEVRPSPGRGWHRCPSYSPPHPAEHPRQLYLCNLPLRLPPRRWMHRPRPQGLRREQLPRRLCVRPGAWLQ